MNNLHFNHQSEHTVHSALTRARRIVFPSVGSIKTNVTAASISLQHKITRKTLANSSPAMVCFSSNMFCGWLCGHVLLQEGQLQFKRFRVRQLLILTQNVPYKFVSSAGTTNSIFRRRRKIMKLNLTIDECWPFAHTKDGLRQCISHKPSVIRTTPFGTLTIRQMRPQLKQKTVVPTTDTLRCWGCVADLRTRWKAVRNCSILPD